MHVCRRTHGLAGDRPSRGGPRGPGRSPPWAPARTPPGRGGGRPHPGPGPGLPFTRGARCTPLSVPTPGPTSAKAWLAPSRHCRDAVTGLRRGDPAASSRENAPPAPPLAGLRQGSAGAGPLRGRGRVGGEKSAAAERGLASPLRRHFRSAPPSARPLRPPRPPRLTCGPGRGNEPGRPRGSPQGPTGRRGPAAAGAGAGRRGGARSLPRPRRAAPNLYRRPLAHTNPDVAAAVTSARRAPWPRPRRALIGRSRFPARRARWRGARGLLGVVVLGPPRPAGASRVW